MKPPPIIVTKARSSFNISPSTKGMISRGDEQSAASTTTPFSPTTCSPTKTDSPKWAYSSKKLPQVVSASNVSCVSFDESTFSPKDFSPKETSVEREREPRDAGPIVPRSRTLANLRPLAAGNPRALLRSKTFPDPFMIQCTPKFEVADSKRRDRQIQTLGKDVEFEHLYDIGSLIGKGGFGKVNDTMHSFTFKPYAVKVVQKSTMHSSTNSTERATDVDKNSTGKGAELTDGNFRDIMELLMNQRHPYIVTIERVFEDTNCYYIVMQRCSGGDLRKYISTLKDEQTRVDEDRMREIVRMLAEALRFLHNMSRIHRDVKPENILYETEIGHVVKLADFDMCCTCPEDTYVVGSSIVGTPVYLAPEVLSLKRYSRQSDLFALGVVMHFCETLIPPKEMVSSRDVTAWCEATRTGSKRALAHALTYLRSSGKRLDLF
jgi:hypothetical protein